MNILLTAINAKYIHSNLAVYSLRANAGRYRKYLSIGEFTINNQKDYILKEIYRQHPDILCFSVYIWNLDYVEEISREFHKLCPQVPIWGGGPEVSYEVEEFLQKNPQFSGVMMGEGEETFRELCGHYADGSPEHLADIAGIAFRRSEGKTKSGKEIPETDGADPEIRINPPRMAADLSRMPFSYDRMEDFSNRIVYYESSRGCPFSCSYCLSSVEKQLRFRDLDLVKEELQFFLDQRVPQIKFVDRTFNCNHVHAMEIWTYIKEHDNGITNFHFEISADLLNEEELELIAAMRPGLIQLEIGVQSTNEVTIREIHRTMKLKELKKIVRRIQEQGNVHEHLDLIAGLPYEDYNSFANSFNEIYELKPNQLQLGFLKVLKGSYMYEHAKEYGICYHARPPYEVLSTNWLSFEEVLKIKQVEEMVEVYYNSGQFEITMKVLEPLYPDAFLFFQHLGAFYENRGYEGMNHSRIQRCEILLEFLQEDLTEGEISSNCSVPENDSGRACFYRGQVLDMIKESLIFDLYYRENCKRRPSWAEDMGKWKQKSREYCRNGKLSHLEPFHYAFPDKTTKSLKELPKYQREPFWVLFHYDQRDPLDHQAQIEYIE